MSCDCHCHFVRQQSHKSLELLADVTGKTVTEMMEPHKEVLTHTHTRTHTHMHLHTYTCMHTHTHTLQQVVLSPPLIEHFCPLAVIITDSRRHDSSKETPAEAPAGHHTDCPNGTYVCTVYTHVRTYVCTQLILYRCTVV